MSIFADFFTPLPPFDLIKDPYNMKTWAGRTRHFMAIFNPLQLPIAYFKAEQSKQLIEKYTQDPSSVKATSNELWKARLLLEAITHPSGKEIPWWGRFSGFAPVNVPIAYGMIAFPTGPVQYVMQWANQSYNCVVNFQNSNKDDAAYESIKRSYAVACTSSIAFAAMLTKLSSKIPVITPVVPFLAVAAAGALNITSMRFSEIQHGIPVYRGRVGKVDESVKVGTSKKAGFAAVCDSAITRLVLPAPILLLPPLVYRAAISIPAIARRPQYHTAVNLITLVPCLVFALPPTIALFPQFSEVEGTALEPSFQSEGQLWYVRGL